MTKTYTNRSNAARAAKADLKALGIEPKNGVNFTIHSHRADIDGAVGYTYELDLSNEQVGPMMDKPHMQEPQAEQAAPAAEEPAEPAKKPKAKKADKAPEWSDEDNALMVEIFTVKRPNRRHWEALKAARAGVLPEAPDFSAPTHKPYRKKLQHIQDAIAERIVEDVEELTAEIEPKSTSRVRLYAFARLAAIALRA